MYSASATEYSIIANSLFFLGGISNIVHRPALTDDPQRRKPDISRAKKYIGWQPRVSILIVFVLLFGVKDTLSQYYKDVDYVLHV